MIYRDDTLGADPRATSVILGLYRFSIRVETTDGKGVVRADLDAARHGDDFKERRYRLSTASAVDLSDRLHSARAAKVPDVHLVADDNGDLTIDCGRFGSFRVDDIERDIPDDLHELFTRDCAVLAANFAVDPTAFRRLRYAPSVGKRGALGYRIGCYQAKKSNGGLIELVDNGDEHTESDAVRALIDVISAPGYRVCFSLPVKHWEPMA